MYVFIAYERQCGFNGMKAVLQFRFMPFLLRCVQEAEMPELPTFPSHDDCRALAGPGVDPFGWLGPAGAVPCVNRHGFLRTLFQLGFPKEGIDKGILST